MKKTFRILAAFMIITMLSVSLTSCTKFVFGKYENLTESQLLGDDVTYEFTLTEYTKTTVSYLAGVALEPEVEKGTYKIVQDPENADKSLIVFTPEGAEEGTSLSFSEGNIDGKKVIIIGGKNYTKVD